jgi:hypothetical protein
MQKSGGFFVWIGLLQKSVHRGSVLEKSARIFAKKATEDSSASTPRM